MYRRCTAQEHLQNRTEEKWCWRGVAPSGLSAAARMLQTRYADPACDTGFICTAIFQNSTIGRRTNSVGASSGARNPGGSIIASGPEAQPSGGGEERSIKREIFRGLLSRAFSGLFVFASYRQSLLQKGQRFLDSVDLMNGPAKAAVLEVAAKVVHHLPQAA